MYRVIIRYRNGHTFHVPGQYLATREEAEDTAQRYVQHTFAASYEIEEVSPAH